MFKLKYVSKEIRVKVGESVDINPVLLLKNKTRFVVSGRRESIVIQYFVLAPGLMNLFMSFVYVLWTTVSIALLIVCFGFFFAIGLQAAGV